MMRKFLDYMVFAAIITLAGRLCIGLVQWIAAGEVFSTTVYMRNVSVGSWPAATNLTNSFTTGGAYTNGTRTNYYRLSATNDLGRIPVSAPLTVIFAGNTNSTNAVNVQWSRKNGLNTWIIEKSTDNANWSNWTTVAGGSLATNFTDRGTNITTWTIFTNVFTTLIPVPSVPWTTNTNDTATTVAWVTAHSNDVETGTSSWIQATINAVNATNRITIVEGLTSRWEQATADGISATSRVKTIEGLTSGWETARAEAAGALLTNGTRAMATNLNMGGYSITNVATNSIMFSNGSRIFVGADIYYVSAAGVTSSMTAGDTNEMASEVWVTNKQYVTQTITNGFVPKTYIDAQDNLALLTNGTRAMAGTLNMAGNTISDAAGGLTIKGIGVDTVIAFTNRNSLFQMGFYDQVDGTVWQISGSDYGPVGQIGGVASQYVFKVAVTDGLTNALQLTQNSVILRPLPTATNGLVSGELWNSNGIVAIKP